MKSEDEEIGGGGGAGRESRNKRETEYIRGNANEGKRETRETYAKLAAKCPDVTLLPNPGVS